MATSESEFKNKLINLLLAQDILRLGFFLREESRFDFLKETEFFYIEVASTFMNYAEKSGPEKTCDDILKFLNCQEIPGHFVLAINGITINDKKVIDNEKGITLVPAKDLQDSVQKSRYMPDHVSEDFILPNGASPLKIFGEEGCSHALFTRDGKPKATVALIYPFPRPKQQGFDVATREDIKDKLFVICRYLTLIGPSSPNPVSFWWQPEPWLYCWPRSHGGWTEENFDIMNTSATQCEINEAELQLCREFLSLPSKVRQKFLVPLARLNYALLRKNIEDKAIELGIAIESLFINGNESKIKNKLSSRADLLLGDNNRSEVFDLFKRLYGYRSSAVHEGSLEKHLKKPESRAKVNVDLQEGITYTVTAIKKLIKVACDEINENGNRLTQDFWQRYWKKRIFEHGECETSGAALKDSNLKEEKSLGVVL